jgi:hypothetical protein
MRMRFALLLIGAVLGAAVALVGTFDAMECVSRVAAVTVFGAAFGAGAAVTAAVQEWRGGRTARRPA